MSDEDAGDQSCIALLRAQYLQLHDPNKFTFPPKDLLRRPEVQKKIFDGMFNESCLAYMPPQHYQLRALKLLVEQIEHSIVDPEEDEISDGLVEYLSTLMVAPKPSELEAAQQKTYVTYTSPENASHQVTVLESRGLLLAAGTTGMRTWEASLHMGAWLATEALDVVKGKNVLELGAGMGFLSIFCAKCLDSQYMLATDGDTGVVENFTENVSLNELEMKDRIDATVLQWGHPLRSPILNDADEQRTFDVVLGADVTYDAQYGPALVATLVLLFESFPAVKVYLSATVRNADTFSAFKRACDSASLELVQIPFDAPVIELQKGFFHAVDPPIHIFLIRQSTRSES